MGAGDIGGEAPSPGLIDHVAIDIVPSSSAGKPYFGTLANGRLMLEDPEVVIQGDGSPSALSGAHGTLDRAKGQPRRVTTWRAPEAKVAPAGPEVQSGV